MRRLDLLRCAGLAVANLALASALHAQGTSIPAGAGKPSTLLGAVVDSLHGGGLQGATVQLDGTTYLAITDADGLFRIDGVPAGEYRVAVFHPLLDTLDVAIGTPLLRLGADSIRVIRLATPSAATLVRRTCPAAATELGPGAIIGHVLHPDTDAPLAGARVSLAWTEVDVSKENGVRRFPRLREGSADSTGRFVICGVPAGTRGTIQAQRGGVSTGEVEVELVDALVAFEDLRLLPSRPGDTALSGTAVLSGRVTDTTGAAVTDADVAVSGGRSATRTGADGSFRLTGLPSGTRDVFVRRVGYAPARAAVNLTSKSPAQISVRLTKEAPALEAVRVEAKMKPAEQAVLEKGGYFDRKRIGNGHYLLGDEITRHRPQFFSDLFQTMSGFRVEPGAAGNAIRGTRGSSDCVTFWIDGIRYRENRPGELDSRLAPEQVIGIETYSPSAAPSEFRALGEISCSVVLVWTNRSIP